MARNYAASGAGGKLVKSRIFDLSLGQEMMGNQARIVDGMRLGPSLTSEKEARYPFDQTAVFSRARLDDGPPPDRDWNK